MYTLPQSFRYPGKSKPVWVRAFRYVEEAV